MVYKPPSPDEQAAVARMRLVLDARGVAVMPIGAGETEDSTLLRYLRARNGNIEKAAGNYSATLAWRSELSVDGLRCMSPVEVLGCDLEVLNAMVRIA